MTQEKKTIQVHQVDAFTEQLFGGNPAGVVTNADELTEDEMKQIAREMNLSETAFVLQPTQDADVRFRFFTPPGDEIKFCGHATIGSLFQLAKLNLFGLGKQGNNSVRVQTNAGILPMTVTNNGSIPKVTFVAPKVKMQPYRLQGEVFAEVFGIPDALLKPGGTILIDTVLNYVYIPTSSLQALSQQQFDFGCIREQFGTEGIVVFCFYSNETQDQRSHLHARGLAPNVGVDEDPFTGSMQAGLVHAAKQNGMISADQQQVTTEQGHVLGRPGFASINHDVKSDELQVTASAVQVFSTEMNL